MSGAGSEAARWTRLPTAGLALGAALLVVAGYRPRFEEASAALASAERQLRSDDITLARVAELERRRTELATRYGAAFGGNAQAAFVRELDRTLRHHGVHLASTVASEASDAPDGPYRSAFPAMKLNIEVRGGYRGIIAVIAALSGGGELVRVEPPSIRRDGSELAAVVPLTLYEPARATPPPALPAERGAEDRR